MNCPFEGFRRTVGMDIARDTYGAICSYLRKSEARFCRWARRQLPRVVDTGRRGILYASGVAICRVPQLASRTGEITPRIARTVASIGLPQGPKLAVLNQRFLTVQSKRSSVNGDGTSRHQSREGGKEREGKGCHERERDLGERTRIIDNQVVRFLSFGAPGSRGDHKLRERWG
jgi:hypothetical protein